MDLPKKCIRFADEFTSAYGPVLVIHALDAIVELTIYLSGRDGYPIAANRRSIFPPTFSPPQDESACDGKYTTHADLFCKHCQVDDPSRLGGQKEPVTP